MNSLFFELPEYRIKNDNKTILQKQSLVFNDGLYLIKGKNGSGKSTLLNFLTGQFETKNVNVQFNGITFSKNNLSEYFDNFVSYFPQEPLILADISVIDNLLYPYEDKDINKAKAILSKVGLEDGIDKSVNDLSFGERQRLSFARIIYASKNVILIDEIDSGLDNENVYILKNIITDLSREHIIILTTHQNQFDDIDGVNIIELSDGLCKYSKQNSVGSPKAEYQKASNATVKQKKYSDLLSTLKSNKFFYIFSALLAFILSFSFIYSATANVSKNNKNQLMQLAYENIKNSSPSFLINRNSKEELVARGINERNIFYAIDFNTQMINDEYASGGTLSGIASTDDFSSFDIVEGRIPEKENECIISDICLESLKKENPNVADYSFTSYSPLKNKTIVGIYKTDGQKLDADYLKNIGQTKNGIISYYRCMFQFGYETIFTYKTSEYDSTSSFFITNNVITAKIINAEDIYYLNVWYDHVLFDSNLDYVYDNGIFSKSILLDIALISIAGAVIISLMTCYGFCYQKRIPFVFERMGGKSRVRLIKPYVICYLISSIIGLLISLPISQIAISITNRIISKSPYLISASYISTINPYACLIALIPVVISSLFLVLLLTLWIVPKTMSRRLNALKLK